MYHMSKIKTSESVIWNWWRKWGVVLGLELMYMRQGIFGNSYSISQEICTRFLLCCALLWLYIDFPISIRLASLALWQSNDCPSASKATLMNMDKYFMWIQYERLHNHNKAKHNKTLCIFLGIYCSSRRPILLIDLPKDQRKHQSYTYLAFVRRICRWLVDSTTKPVTRKMFPFGDVIMGLIKICRIHLCNDLYTADPGWWQMHVELTSLFAETA